MLAVLQLANILSTEALFYACIFPFIAFFGSFAFIMYPLRDVLHPTRKSLAILTCLTVSFCIQRMYERDLLLIGTSFSDHNMFCCRVL